MSGDRVLEVSPGASWLRGARLETLQGIDLAASRDSFTVAGPEGLRTRSGSELLREVAMATALADPHVMLHAADQDAWELLPAKTQQDALELAGHLNEALTGSKYGLLREGELVDPRYHPNLGETIRKKTKAAELGIHWTTLYRSLAAYREEGLIGLTHKNFDPLRDPKDKYSAAELDVAKRFVLQNLEEARRDLNKLRPLFSVFLEEHDVAITKPGRRNALLAYAGAGAALQGDAKTKQAKANRRSKGSFRRRDQAPGEVIQIDSSPLNLALWSPDEKAPDIVRSDMLGAVDLGPGRAHTRLAIGKASARDACLLIHDVMNPMPPQDMVDKDPHWARWMGLPHALEVGHTLGVEIGTVITDHGKEFVNRALLALLAMLDITVIFAAVRDPLFKAFIESLMRSLAGTQQLMPGFIGNSVANRARTMPPRGQRLTHNEAEQALQNWVHLEYNETPLERHGILNHPRRALSPNEIRRLDLSRGAPLRLPRTPDLVYAFLPALVLTPAADGLHSRYLRYWSPIIDRLLDHAGDAQRAGRPIVVRYDPYDLSRVFWHEPKTYRWHTLYALGRDGGVLPSFSESLLPAIKALHVRELPSDSFKDLRRQDFIRYARALLDAGKSARKTLAFDFMRVERAIPAVPWDPADAPQLGAAGVVSESLPVLRLIDGPEPILALPEHAQYAIDDSYDLSEHLQERA
jgi:hypothetical protein